MTKTITIEGFERAGKHVVKLSNDDGRSDEAEYDTLEEAQACVDRMVKQVRAIEEAGGMTIANFYDSRIHGEAREA